MVISDQIKIGPSVRADSQQIIGDILTGDKYKKKLWFAVTTTMCSDPLLYILSSFETRHEYYKTRPLKILGIAGSWMEACEIVRSLFQEGYEKGEIFSMDSFLKDY